MAAYQGIGSRIKPGVELHTITVRLDRIGPPTITAIGKVKTGNRTVDMSSEAEIRTALIGPKAAAFIREVREMYCPDESDSPEKPARR